MKSLFLFLLFVGLVVLFASVVYGIHLFGVGTTEKPLDKA